MRFTELGNDAPNDRVRLTVRRRLLGLGHGISTNLVPVDLVPVDVVGLKLVNGGFHISLDGDRLF